MLPKKRTVAPIVLKNSNKGHGSGRGFSLAELKEANLSIHQAKLWGVPFDRRRKSTHKDNVEQLEQIKKEKVK